MNWKWNPLVVNGILITTAYTSLTTWKKEAKEQIFFPKIHVNTIDVSET